MSGWLIYHPKRKVSKFGDLTVYHDEIQGNQDPYIWNRKFLHSFCHMTEMSPEKRDICFWVSGDHFPEFTKLFCDLVFVVKEKCFWNSVNEIKNDDAIVDSPEAFMDHYYPGSIEHRFTRRKSRFTLKAHPEDSFQPQAANGQLMDVLPVMESVGISFKALRQGLKSPKGFGSRPMRLDSSLSQVIYQRIHELALFKIVGLQLQQLRKKHSEIWSENDRDKKDRENRNWKCC